MSIFKRRLKSIAIGDNPAILDEIGKTGSKFIVWNTYDQNEYRLARNFYHQIPK